MDDLVESALDGIEPGQMFDHAVAAGQGLSAEHRLAIVEHGPRGQVAVVVGERLEELHRKRVLQVVQDIFPGRDVDPDIRPLLGRDVGEAALEQGFSGRDNLNDRRVAGGEIPVDRGDQRRRLHRGDKMTEEALLGALERRQRSGHGLAVQRALGRANVGRLHRGAQVVVDDLERTGVGVVDGCLILRELVFDEFVLDAFVGQRTRRIEPERLEVSGQHLHGGDATLLDGRDELGTRREGEVGAAPKAETLRIGEVLDRGCACC